MFLATLRSIYFWWIHWFYFWKLVRLHFLLDVVSSHGLAVMLVDWAQGFQTVVVNSLQSELVQNVPPTQPLIALVVQI